MSDAPNREDRVPFTLDSRWVEAAIALGGAIGLITAWVEVDWFMGSLSVLLLLLLVSHVRLRGELHRLRGE